MKCPASCHAATVLDRGQVRLGAEHVLAAVALGHERRHLLATQLDDVPGDLLVVVQHDSEAPLGKQREEIPVVVQCRVDVDRDPHVRHRVDGHVARTARPLHDGYGTAGRSDWLDIDWSAHQRWVEVAGTPANVIELGDGPPLLFVHGLSGCWQNWLENLPHFARTHRAIAVDLPGFGASPMPAEPIAITGYARFLELLLDALGAERASVVGNSMGGHIAAALAIAAPERVEHLALVSPAGVSSAHANRQAALAVGRAIALAAGRVDVAIDVLARRPGLRRGALGFVCHRGDLLSAPLARELMGGSGKPAFLPALEAVLAHPIEERLGEIACPSLLVWGRQDRVIPVRDAKAFARAMPGLRVELLDATGHVAMLERPARFNALLEELLAEQPAAVPARAAAPAAAVSD